MANMNTEQWMISQPRCYFQQCKRDLKRFMPEKYIYFINMLLKQLALDNFAHRDKLDQPNNVVRIINSIISHITWCILVDYAVTSRKWSCLLFIFCIYRVAWKTGTLHLYDLWLEYASNSLLYAGKCVKYVRKRLKRVRKPLKRVPKRLKRVSKCIKCVSKCIKYVPNPIQTKVSKISFETIPPPPKISQIYSACPCEPRRK